MHKLASTSYRVVEANFDDERQGNIANIRIVPLKPMAVKTYKDCPPLGRIIIRGLGQTIRSGVI